MSGPTDSGGVLPSWPTAEVSARFHEALVKLVREANDAGVEIAGWLAEALGEVAQSLPGDTEALLGRRPGSWEADFTRQLINGTIGWPGFRDWPEKRGED